MILQADIDRHYLGYGSSLQKVPAATSADQSEDANVASEASSSSGAYNIILLPQNLPDIIGADNTGAITNNLKPPDPQLNEEKCGEGLNLPASSHPLSLLMLMIILFSAMSGLLMGYDLCVIAVVLQPISDEFQLCPAQQLLNFTEASLLTPAKDFSVKPKSIVPSRRRRLSQRPCAFASPATSRRSLVETDVAFHSCLPKELFVAMVSPGAAIGSFLAGFTADAAGRKLTLGLSDALIVIGTFTMGLGQQFKILLFGRFVLGLGIGTGFVIFSTYVSEISPDHRRGQLVSCQEVAQCVGCLLSYSIVAVTGQDNLEWRWLLIGAGIVAAVQLCGVFLLPESPRWLIRHQEILHAERALRRIEGLPVASDEPKHEVQVELQSESESTKREKKREQLRMKRFERKRSIRAGKERYVYETMSRMKEECVAAPLSPDNQNSWLYHRDLRTLQTLTSAGTSSTAPILPLRDRATSCCANAIGIYKEHYCQLLVALGCATCQNLTASTAVLYYSTELFNLAGLSSPLLPGMGIGLAKLVGIIIVISCVEYVGRKRFLMIGSIGTFICHLLFALAFSLPAETAPSTLTSSAVVIAMIAYMFCQNISWAGLMFVVASEVLPSSVRGRGMGFTITWFWILAFITQSTLESLMQAISIPVIISEQLLAPPPDLAPVVYVEVPVIEERIRTVPVKRIVEVEKVVPKYEYEYNDKIKEVLQIQYVDRAIEREIVREVIRSVGTKQIIDRPREVVRTIPKIEYVQHEKVVNIPGEIIEIPRPYDVEKRVEVAKRIDKEIPVVVAQIINPMITESQNVIDVDIYEYVPRVIPVEVHVAKPVSSHLVAVGATEHVHKAVTVPAAQFNTILRSLNRHLSQHELMRLPYMKEYNNNIPFLGAHETPGVVYPIHGVHIINSRAVGAVSQEEHRVRSMSHVDEKNIHTYHQTTVTQERLKSTSVSPGNNTLTIIPTETSSIGDTQETAATANNSIDTSVPQQVNITRMSTSQSLTEQQLLLSQTAATYAFTNDKTREAQSSELESVVRPSVKSQESEHTSIIATKMSPYSMIKKRNACQC